MNAGTHLAGAVVVGHDGSPQAARALESAIVREPDARDRARRRAGREVRRLGHRGAERFGRGGFQGLLMGSVAIHCAHRAASPTLVVPHSPQVN